MRITTFFLSCVLAITSWSVATAELKLGSMFGDNMVLQRGEDLNIWGWADANAEVTVKLQQQTVSATANAEGKWIAKLAPLTVGDAFDVSISSGDKTLTIKNCLAGEVWICSGQSNMEWTVAGSKDAQEEIAAANFPNIRHIKLDHKTAFVPQETAAHSGWTECSPATVGNYTAVGYFFARDLHEELNVPIGLINTSWGGTLIEAWTSGEALSTVPEFADRVSKIVEQATDPKIAAEKQVKAEKYNQLLQAALADRTEDESSLNGDADSWKQVSLPHRWEEGGKDFDGIGWYRRRVTIPDGWVGKELSLSLAKIDDADETYVNGNKIGETNDWNADRRYKIDASIVKNTELSIAIRVTDGQMGGGVHGEAADVSVALADEKPMSISDGWRFKFSDKTIAAGPRPGQGFAGPHHPTVLYNAMIEPLAPATFRGAIWYQGESNAGRGYQYRTLFPLMINDWRKQFGHEFPFYWVQLANFTAPSTAPGNSNWAELREAQSMTLSVPNSGQAVIIDIGEADDIHPRNKQDVGKRLARIALAKDYGKSIEYSGPTFRDLKIDGNQATINFDHATGLQAMGSADGSLKRFEIAGSDQKFVFADAKVVGESVVVSHPDVKEPVAVRYAWAHNPEGCNLYNGDGLPASPFRTDTWPGETDNYK
jgi:sialate O-acetylesterase